MTRTPALALTAGLLFFTSLAAQAADGGQPVAAQANFDHPAVVIARSAKTPRIDPNTALVQPPASVTWTVQPAANVLASSGQPALK